MMWLFDRINGFLGSVTVLFLFFSGIAVAFLLLISAIGRKRREAEKPFRGSVGYNDLKKTQNDLTFKKRRSPFGSLCLALAGTLGVGNISGVAAAITVGGAGAVFWMWVSAIFCSVLKYAEVVLAVRFRKVTPQGGFVGGAHLYIKNGLGLKRVAVLFGLLCVFSSYTIGNMTQVNAAAQSLRYSLGMNEYICGAVCFILILVFCRSGSAIYSFTLRLIPVLCLGYIGLSLAVILPNVHSLGAILRLIFSEAFSPMAGVGGILGVICGRAVRIGITRGVMSNEAGCGTAPIAHASAEVEDPSSQGILGIVEVLFDTLFLCTLTAFVILLSDGVEASGASTVFAIKSFSLALGEWVAIPLSVSMLLFAVASAMGWNYYGRTSLSFLGVGSVGMSVYYLSYAVCAFFGCGFSEGLIWSFSDLSIYLMSLINTVAVLMLTGFSKKNENGIDIPRLR